MKKKEEQTKKQALPVMKQLARPISKAELAIIAGAGYPGSTSSNSGDRGDTDFQN